MALNARKSLFLLFFLVLFLLINYEKRFKVWLMIYQSMRTEREIFKRWIERLSQQCLRDGLCF